MKRLIFSVLMAFSISSFAVEEVPKFYWVHIKAKNVEERSKVATMIHIDQVIEDSVYSVVSEHDYSVLKQKVPELLFESYLMDPSVYGGNINQGEDDQAIEFPKGDELFHTYDEIKTLFNDLEKKYPSIVSQINIGKSVEGKDLFGLRISSIKESVNSFIPGILFVGTHHAREHISTEVPVFLAKYLAENYSKDSEVTSLVDHREIFIIPLLNPDGASFDIKGKRYKMWRKNRTPNGPRNDFGVDLNRNYGFEWGTGGSSTDTESDVYMGTKPFSEPETLALKNFVTSKPNIRILLSFHTYSELILYPWGHTNDSLSGNDFEVFKNMATTMAKWNGYTPMQSSELYIASGDTCDWAYGELGVFCFTFELSPKSYGSGGFYPGASFIDKVNNANLKPALYLIEKSADPYSAIN